MTSNLQPLDWSDLYGDGARTSDPAKAPPAPAGASAERQPIVPPLNGLRDESEASDEPMPVAPRRGSATLRGATGGSSTPRAGTPHAITPRKTEQLAQPRARYGHPVEAPVPNYGQLLDFSEEQRRDHRLNVPRLPAKRTPSCTVPTQNRRIERLAQPRRPPPSSGSSSPNESSYDRITPPAPWSASSAAIARLARPRTPVSQEFGPPPPVRRFSSPRTASRPPPTHKDPVLDRLAQPKQRSQANGNQRTKAPAKVYGGTTAFQHTPIQPFRVPATRGEVVPEWTTIQRPRTATAPRTPRGRPATPRDSSAHRRAKECAECRRAQYEQLALQQQAAAAPGPVAIRSEPAKPKATTPPLTAEVPMPKPPAEVKTKRFQPTDDGPQWPSKEEEEKPKPPPVVVAVHRSSQTTADSGAVPAEPAPAVVVRPKPVPVTLAVRRSKPIMFEAEPAPEPPAAVAQPARPAPQVAPGCRIHVPHRRSTATLGSCQS